MITAQIALCAVTVITIPLVIFGLLPWLVPAFFGGIAAVRASE